MKGLFAAIVLIGLVLSGCAARKVAPPTVVRIIETQEVKVPVLVPRQPPAELLAPVVSPLPVFVPPSDLNSSSALTTEGERLLRALIEDLLVRIAAWKAWATETP